MNGNNHRYFVQFMLHNGSATVDQALSYCKEVDPELRSLTHLQSLILQINKNITKQYYKIIITTCEITGDEVVLWINAKNDDISRLQTTFSSIELEYFHAILQEIITSDQHRIDYFVCLNITSTLTAAFSREKGEKVLNKWFNSRYFIKHEGHVYLGSRLIVEFASYLRAHTQNCICGLCSELVFGAKSCGSCDKPFHSFCLEKYFQAQRSCPNCKNEWQEAEYTQSTQSQVQSNIRDETFD